VTDSGRDFGKLPHVIICDFGTAEISGGTMSKLFSSKSSRVAGTPATMAPEVMTGNATAKSDIWSMGCVMFEMLTNQMPFNLSGSMAEAAKKQVLWQELHQKGPKWDLFRSSAAAKQLCNKMLAYRDSNRPSAWECLRQPWIMQGYDPEMNLHEKSSLRRSIYAWNHRSSCRQAMCVKMASSCSIVDKFASAYLKIDRDINGMLEKNEVLAALLMCGYDKDSAKKLYEGLDANGDGVIHFLEFSAMCLPALDNEFDELLAKEFYAIAKTRGFITQIEMAPLFQELREIEQFSTTFADLDVNKDGKIDFKEFCTYFGRPGVSYSCGAEEAKPDKEDPSSMSAKHPPAGSSKVSSEKTTEKAAAKTKPKAKAKARTPSKDASDKAAAEAALKASKRASKVAPKASPKAPEPEEPAMRSMDKTEEVTAEEMAEMNDLLGETSEEVAKRFENITVSL